HYFGRFTHAAARCKSIFDNAGIAVAVVERKLREWCGRRVRKLLALPDTLDPLVIYYPARPAQQRGDLSIAIAAVLPGKLDNIGGETLLVVTTARDLVLCRAVLPERHTSATLGDMQLRSDLLMQVRRRAGLRSFPAQPPAE